MTGMRGVTGRRQSRERGAAMIEFALVLFPLALLAFGIAEMGTAWVAHNRVEGAVSTAARVGAASGNTEDADLNLLRALQSALPDEALANLDRVIVFQPTNADGGIPAGCMKPVGSTNEVGVNSGRRCNTYSGATVRGALTSLGSADDYWPATSRIASLANPGGPEQIGVWVRTRHENITGTFWGDFTITRQSIFRLQPDFDG